MNMRSARRKTIHLIIFSRLQSYDGGRETWLKNFMNEAKRVDSRFDILVYYFSDMSTQSDKLIDTVYSCPELFINVKIPRPGNIFQSILRVYTFQRCVFKKIRRSIESEDIVLGIGNLNEGLIPFVFSFFPPNRRKIFTGLWLRSIYVKQQAALADPVRLKLMEHVEVRILRSLSFVIANGWDTSSFYKEHYGIESFVIPNALVLSKYGNISKFNPNKTNLVVAYIGRLSKEKGFTEFIDSIKVFNGLYPQQSSFVEFQVVGDGPLRDLLKREKMDNVRYMGVLANSEIPNYMGSIDCGVALTSAKTIGGGGLSHGYLELLAAGRIVLVWDNPIYRQIDCQDAVILIEEGDIRAMAASYLDILTNRKLYEVKAENAIRLADSFSIQNHFCSFAKIVDNL
nr:glycosyltransferase [Cytophagales bacterium]